MKQLAVALAVTSVCMMMQAKEVVWSGAVDTDFAKESNWTGGAPVAGDTAKFTAKATITGDFDFGADGLTIDVASGVTLTCQTAFAGTGQLTKVGAGTIAFNQQKVGTFTGGLRMEGGVLAVKYDDAWNLTIGDAANVVTLVMTGSDSDPKISFPDWGSCFNNPVRVIGTCKPGVSVFSMVNTSQSYRGAYSADCDTRIATGQSGTTTISGSGVVDVSGHALTLSANNASTVIALGSSTKTICGDIVTIGNGQVKVNGLGDATSTLIVSNRTSLLNAWAGNARVEGADAVLTLDKNTDNKTVGSFSGGSSVVLADGGKIVLADGIAFSVKSLTIDGNPVSSGIHPISDFDGRIEGTGDVMVGCKTWSGGDTGLLSAPANWSDGAAPACGDVLIFSKNVTLDTEEFVLTEGSGLTFLISGAETVVNCKTDFSGEGGLTLDGQGYLRFRRKANGTFTGGVRAVGGRISVVNGDGSTWSCTVGDAANVITLVMSGDAATDPTICFSNYSCGLNNKVVVEGTASAGHDTFSLTDNGSMNGDVESETDVQFGTHAGSRSLRILGNVAADGNTIYAETNEGKNDIVMFGQCDTGSGSFVFDKKIVGNLTTRGLGSTEIFSSGTSAEATLTVCSRTTLFNAWAGDVVVSGATLLVTKTNAWGRSTTASLAPTATVRIENGGKLVLENGKDLSVAELIVNGVPVTKGVHTFGDPALGGALESSEARQVWVGCDKKWIGGAEGLLTDGANWSDSAPAVAGDILVFDKDVKLLDGEAMFDLEDKGLTFAVASGKTVKSLVRYTGTGRIVKQSKGAFTINASATGDFSGGLRVEDGVVNVGANSSWGSNVGNGKGVVEVAQGAGRTPQVVATTYGGRLNNPVRITGEAGSADAAAVLQAGDRGGFKGAVTSDADFTISSGYHTGYFGSAFSAPGRTMTVKAGTVLKDDSGKVIRTCQLSGALDVSVVKKQVSRLQVDVGTTNAANTLATLEGRTLLSPAAVWAGTNVVVSGETAELQLTAKRNLSKLATLSLADGGKLVFTNAMTVCVGQLFVDGKQKESGVYTSANLPDLIDGDGRIRAGQLGLPIIVR